MDPLKFVTGWWNGMGGGMKALVVAGGLLAVVGGLFGSGYVGPHEAQVPVGPEMAVEEVKAVRDKLSAAGIPNTVDRRATNVLVPENRRAEAVVLLAADGLPSRGTGKGLESFEEPSLTATPFANQVNYQRALQNELARAITKLEPVAAANVLIARPEPTPFLRDQRPPTASVVLRLKPNGTLGKSGAVSIVALVAHAVDGLKKENVTVVDSTGRMLSDPNAGSKDVLDGAMVDYRQKIEQYLAQKAQDVLTKSLGNGRAVVTVNADLNYQAVRERQKKYDTDGKVLNREQTTSNKSNTNAARGTPGTSSNAAARPGGGSSGSTGRSEEETLTSEYLVSLLERETEDKAGAVTRLTVSAVVDLVPSANPDGTSAGTEPLMPPEKVEELIRNAVGYKAGRDEITVANMRMTTPVAPIPEPDEDGPKLAKTQAQVALARNVCLGVSALVAFAIVPLALLRRSRPAKPPEPAPPPPPTLEQKIAAERTRRREQLEKMAELTRTNPDTVADVFNVLVSK